MSAVTVVRTGPTEYADAQRKKRPKQASQALRLSLNIRVYTTAPENLLFPVKRGSLGMSYMDMVLIVSLINF